MKKFLLSTFLIVLIGVLATPVSVSAATKAGVKPGSFFYFFDTSFEKINLFFTFNPEKKAQEALEYADERLAEAEAVAGEKNTNAVKTAVAGYESNIVLAAEESKQIKDKGKAEGLLSLIADNTSKHQEILSDVLSKVPDEAKEAIIKAIKASKKGQEEALKQIAELKGEVEQLKKEVVELKAKDEKREKMIEELSKQKSESVPASTQAPKPTTPSTPQVEEKKNTNIVTLPNGAVVEMDINGNIIHYIKEAPNITNIQPTQQTSSRELEDGLNRLYVQLTLNFIKTSSDHLVNIAALLASKFDILVSGRDYCVQTYRDLIKEKDECMLSYPLPDPTLGEKITQEVTKLDNLYKRVSIGTNSITEAANMLQEYNSIEARIYSFKDYIPSPLQPLSMSSVPKSVVPMGSFRCTISPTGGSYSCYDSFSNINTSCQLSPTGSSWGCRNSDGSNIRCQVSPTRSSVECSSH